MRRIIYCGFTLALLLGSCKDASDSNKSVTATEISFTKEGSLTIVKPDSVGSIQIDIEVADNDYERQTGLMYRNSMEEKQGMLFIMDQERQQAFYMKNTRFPLDIIYVGSDQKVVSIQKNAQPLNTSSLPSGAPAKYVLELNGGLTDKWNIKPGDSLSWQIQ
ncbi:DUF192 domain-containing protein [Gilvibacter sediminis]|uniref:DUF192 domain-containing protein n=1 Tax=Gilvibacter sediminis TaxID=379071 RepID=UPI0023503CF9|nr:DUF192 domain-containing protein [Gilvibacter sediminis]MDC7997687.1 DUF192 domain-containing protein [Gilvibacter sediminis]